MVVMNLPQELVEKILSKTTLPTADKFNAAFACKRWFSVLSPALPQLSHLSILFDSRACNGDVVYKTTNQTTARVCQCDPHVGKQRQFLDKFISTFGSQLYSLSIDDCLVNRDSEEMIRDDVLALIFSKPNGTQLSHLIFSNVDFHLTRLWTLSILAKCSSLRTLTFDACKFPPDLRESFLIRLIVPSFPTIEEICITESSLITDKFCMNLAKMCPRLSILNLRRCKNVTSFSLIAFCESLAAAASSETGSRPVPITIDLRDTDFNVFEFGLQLNSPLVKCKEYWKVQSVVINVGFDRRALLIGTVQNDSVITVYTH